jgi:branched-chain amino acid transport system ATP-binding protein
MFNLIAGLYQPTEGEIILDGEDVTELTSHQLFHKGLLRTFQIAHEFPTLSVLENLMMVPANQLGESLMNTWLRRSQINEEEKALQIKAEEVVEFLSISHLKNERAGNLSGGQKKIIRVGKDNDG